MTYADLIVLRHSKFTHSYQQLQAQLKRTLSGVCDEAVDVVINNPISWCGVYAQGALLICPDGVLISTGISNRLSTYKYGY